MSDINLAVAVAMLAMAVFFDAVARMLEHREIMRRIDELRELVERGSRDQGLVSS